MITVHSFHWTKGLNMRETRKSYANNEKHSIEGGRCKTIYIISVELFVINIST
jgi:hypothetical protein